MYIQFAELNAFLCFPLNISIISFIYVVEKKLFYYRLYAYVFKIIKKNILLQQTVKLLKFPSFDTSLYVVTLKSWTIPE